MLVLLLISNLLLFWLNSLIFLFLNPSFGIGDLIGIIFLISPNIVEYFIFMDMFNRSFLKHRVGLSAVNTTFECGLVILDSMHSPVVLLFA